MNIAAFASYIFLTAFTPGPNNIMALSNSARFGLRRALWFCVGVLCGFVVDMVLCAGLTMALYTFIPKVEPYMKWIGAAYILLLAWVIYRDKPGGEGKRERLDPASIFTGMIMQFVNVKVLLYGITALSVFVLPHYKDPAALTLAVVVLSLVGFVGTCAWALFGSLFQNFYRDRKQVLNAIMALMLVYCAVASLW